MYPAYRKRLRNFCEKSLSQQLQHCFDKFPVTPVSRPSFDCLTVCAGGVCVISRSQSCLGSCARDSTGDLNKNGSPSALTQALWHIPPSADREGKREKEKCCGLGFIRTVGRGNSDGSYSFRYYNNSTPKRDIRDMLHIQHSINTFFYRFLCIPATDLHCDLLECSSLAFHVPQSDDFLRQPIIDV